MGGVQIGDHEGQYGGIVGSERRGSGGGSTAEAPETPAVTAVTAAVVER